MNGDRGRWSAKAKRQAVLRLLGGEIINALTPGLKVTASASNLTNRFAYVGLLREITGYAQPALSLRSQHVPARQAGMRQMSLRVPGCERRIEASKLELIGFLSEGHA